MKPSKSMLVLETNDCTKSRSSAIIEEVVVNILLVAVTVMIVWSLAHGTYLIYNEYGYKAAFMDMIVTLAAAAVSGYILSHVPFCHVFRKWDVFSRTSRSIYRCAGYFDLTCFASESVAEYINEKIIEGGETCGSGKNLLPNYYFLDMVDDLYGMKMTCRRDPLGKPMLYIRDLAKGSNRETMFDLSTIFRAKIGEVEINEELLDALIEVLHERNYDTVTTAVANLLSETNDPIQIS